MAYDQRRQVGDFMRWPGEERAGFLGTQRGFSLIEILVALALLSIISVAFLRGLFTTSQAVAVSQESVVAESLARSQVELIKAQDYVLVDVYDPDDPDNCYEQIDVPAGLAGAGYSVEINTPVSISVTENQTIELQSIAVAVKRHGEGMFTLSVYKAEE